MLVKTLPISGTVVHEMDIRKNANGNQPEVFGHATINLCKVQIVPIGLEIVSEIQSFPEQSLSPRKKVIESLERSLVEHGDIWAELAEM